MGDTISRAVKDIYCRTAAKNKFESAAEKLCSASHILPSAIDYSSSHAQLEQRVASSRPLAKGAFHAAVPRTALASRVLIYRGPIDAKFVLECSWRKKCPKRFWEPATLR